MVDLSHTAPIEKRAQHWHDHAPSFAIGMRLTMRLWYDRPTRSWWGAYFTSNGDQHGDAWHSYRRDDALVYRPDPLPLCD